MKSPLWKRLYIWGGLISIILVGCQNTPPVDTKLPPRDILEVFDMTVDKDGNAICTTNFNPVCAVVVHPCLKEPCPTAYKNFINLCIAGRDAYTKEIAHRGECTDEELKK